MGCSGSRPTQTKQQSPQHNNAPVSQPKTVDEAPVVAQKQTEEGGNEATLPPTDNKHIENQDTVPSPKEQESDKEEEKKDDEKPTTTEEAKPEPDDTRTDAPPAEPESAPAAQQEEAKPDAEPEAEKPAEEPAGETQQAEATPTTEEEAPPKELATCAENGETLHETAVDSQGPGESAPAGIAQDSDRDAQETAVGAQPADESQEGVAEPVGDAPTTTTTEEAEQGRKSATETKMDEGCQEAEASPEAGEDSTQQEAQE